MTRVQKSQECLQPQECPLTKLQECLVPQESHEPRAECQEPRAKRQEPRARSQEPRAKRSARSRVPRAQSRVPRAECQEPRAECQEQREVLYISGHQHSMQRQQVHRRQLDRGPATTTLQRPAFATYSHCQRYLHYERAFHRRIATHRTFSHCQQREVSYIRGQQHSMQPKQKD
jgi:hypothetical protein